MALSITKVEGLWAQPDYLKDRAAERIVLVTTVPARGFVPTVWGVTYDRHGRLAYSWREGPGKHYIPADEVPQEVAQAAEKVWLKSPGWVPRRPLGAGRTA